ALNSLLVFVFAKKLLEPLNPPLPVTLISIVSGLLFLFLPVHVEPVTWYSAQMELFASFFGISSVILYLDFVGQKLPMKLWLSLSAFAIALGFKESAVPVAFIVLMLSLFFHYPGKQQRSFLSAREVLLCIPYFVLLLAFITVRGIILHSLIAGYGSAIHLRFDPNSLATGFTKTVVATYGATLPNDGLRIADRWKWAVPTLFFVSFGFLAIRRKVLPPANLLLFLLIAFILASLMTLNLELRLDDFQGTRFTYQPSIYLSILFPAMMFTVFRRKYAIFLPLMLLPFYAVSIQKLNRNWYNAGEIARTATEEIVAPNGKTIVFLNLPDSLYGAYVYRNCINRSLHLFRAIDSDIYIASRVYLSDFPLKISLSSDNQNKITLSDGSQLEKVHEAADYYLFSEGRFHKFK
ncbi:MAG: hypothetical protein C5B54_10450, partial [Acidobacteria bacterium]